MTMPVSAETSVLIQDFLSRHRTWGLLRESSEKLLSCLDAIQRRGEPAAAVQLWPGIAGRSSKVQQKTLEVMTDLLAGSSASMAVDLIVDAQCEALNWPHESRELWLKMTPAAVRSWADDRPACAGLLVLLSGHHSGYVREAAIRGLDGLTQPFVLSALRNRLNDWVEPVRRAALQAMRHFLTSDHAASLIASLDLLESLRRCGRADHQPLLDQVDMVLREPAARSHLEAGLFSPVPAIRRGCYIRLLQVDGSTDVWLTNGLEAKDSWIRLHAAQCIRGFPAERISRNLIDRIAASGLRPVRQIAVELIAERGDADWLRVFLLDSSPTLREFTRFYLTKILGNFDAKQFYRDGLNSASGLRLTRFLSGIGETGDGDDVHVVIVHVQNQRTSIRLAALRALAHLAPGKFVEMFLSALADPSGRVRQTATAALAARRSEVSIDRMSTWARSADPGGRCAALCLIGHYPCAVRLPVLLPFLVDVDDSVRGSAEKLCLRSLWQILNPFLKPDPWREWAEQHSAAWSPSHQERVRELIRRSAQGHSFCRF